MGKLSAAKLKEMAEGMALEEACRWLSGLGAEYGETAAKLADKYIRRLEAEREEMERLKRMWLMEDEAYALGYKAIGGVDEVGRGPLAGPVVTACVILPHGIILPKLNDSKKLTPQQRDLLYDEILEKAIAYGIGMVDHVGIDAINILNATKKAMELAVGAMAIRPDYLIIDALKLNLDIVQKSVNKADENSASVAAASIVAKVTRDRLMEKMDETYPGYGFKNHKGYPTAEHYEAIVNLGLCPIHRRSFTRNIAIPGRQGDGSHVL